ncbi:MAG: FecR domain-containing protein [Chitinophagaceae bacterium]|nr:FecR domain-containing protein [Chitinophagaceae bacterium]
MRQKKALRLLRRYMDGSATAEEKAIVDKWYASVAEPDGSSIDDETIKEQLYLRIVAAMNKDALVVPFYKKALYKWTVAASIILMVGAGCYFFSLNKAKEQTEIVSVPVPQDIAPPAANRAMITLANGHKVFLDSMANGSIAVQGNIKIVKDADGKLSYQASAKGEGQEEIYNTLYNPRGSKVIDIALADGSHVWLNAGSSLTYPVAFVGKERKVSITGEAYFEVTRNAARPFIVDRGKMSVRVLGTHFNVNAYDDETDIRVTLLEGSVKVSGTRNTASSIIKPGEQAVFSQAKGGAQIRVSDDVDVDEVMAWKNGKFQFGEKTDIQTIMRQISRWYDVEVEYKGNVTGLIGGSISRSANVSSVLEMLEKTGEVKFKIEGKKIIGLK